MANSVKIVLTAEDKASDGVSRVAGRIEALEKASSAVAARMDAIRNALAGVVTVGAGLALSKQFIDMADSMSLLQSRVKLATSGVAEFAQVQADLFALAQRNSVSLEEVAGAYSRLSDPVKRLGGGSKEAIGIIDALSKSLKISGASAQESAAAIQQFGQAMGSGKLQGDEFKSLAESAPRFMKALSEGSGIAAENLKQMASDGKLTADVVGNALLKSLEKLNAEAAQMPDTVGQAMTRLKNDIAKAVDEINQAGGINGGLAGMIGDAGQLIGPIKQEMIEAFQAVSLWVENNRDGLIEIGRVVGGVVADVWRMAEAMASVAGFVADVSAKSGGLKTVLESVRIILAGIEDGITIIGAAFVKVGADVVDVLYKPLGNLMLAYGNALDMLGSSSAGWWQETGDRIRNTTNAAHEYADGVHAAFANSESALGRLNTQLANTAAAQSEAGSAAAAAGVALAEQGKTAAKTAAAFASLRSSIKGDADKGKSGTDPYQSLLENLRRQLATTEKLSAVEKLNRDLQDKQYAKIGTLKKAELQAVAAQIDAQQRLAAVRKLDEADEAARVAWTKRHGQALAEEEQAIWDKVEAEVEAAAAIGKSRSEIEARTLARMEEQLAWREALDLQDEETAQLKRKIAAQKAMIAAVRNTESTQAAADAGKAAIDAAKKAAEAAAAEWQKTVDTIDGTFHDGFVGMLEKGKADWESFTDSLATTFKSAVADEIYKMTLKPLVLNVVGSFSGAGAPAVPGADGQSLSISNGFGVISGVQAAWAGVNGGIANAASSFATSGMGQWAGLSTTYGAGYTMGPPTAAGAYGYTAGGTALTSSGSSFVASAAPYAAAIAALAYGDHLMKAGWGLDNNRKGYAASAAGAVAGGVAAGASAGASAGSSVGPVGTVVGAVVGAIAVPVLDRLFGHNNKTNADAAGIQGSFDLSGFSGDQWQQFSKKGGTFRSDKRWTDTYDVSSDIDKELDSAFRKTVAKLQDMGKTLGVETSKSIEGFTHEFSLQLSDNGDMSKAGEKLAGEITRAADELVSRMVPNVDEFARLGETASQTFTRLNQEVAATDAILLAMGKNAAEAFGGVGLASIAAREDLIDLAGGLEQLANKTQSFYANFYSSEEQVQLAAKQAQKVLTEGFAELGQGIPATREAFRALVESQDLSTEAGRKLWNSLLDLQDEFDIVADGADATAASMKAAADKLAAATTTAQQGQASLFDTFASDGQKLAAAQKLVSDTFASIGTAVPENAAAFLTLAQSIDPATEAGQSLIATLSKISGAFAYTQTSASAAAAAVMAAQNAAANSYFANVDALNAASSLSKEGQSAVDQLFGSVNDGAKAAAEAAASAASDAAQAWKSAAQSLKSALDNVRTGAIAGLSPEARYRMLQAQFASTSSAAMAGDQTAAGRLGQIASDFLDASKNYNASGTAFQADRQAAEAALERSLQYAQAQSSLQETIAGASRAAVSELQSLNSNLSGFASQALEMLSKGGYASGSKDDAAAAVTKLAQAQADFSRYFATTAEGVSNTVNLVSGQATLTRLAGDMAMIKTSAGQVEYIRAAESIVDVAKRLGDVRATWERDYGIKLPSYAVGTAYVPQDQIAQIHQGEMIIPAAAASQLRKYGMSNQVDSGLQAEMLAELRATRQGQQQSYNAMQQQLAASNARLMEMNKRLAAVEDQARLTRAGQ